MRERVAYWRWLWRERQWWFLRKLPPMEMDTVLFTGLPGAGKTTFGTDLCVSYLRAGIRVYSNTFIRDNFSGRTARPVLTWLDILEATVEGLESGEPTVVYVAEIEQYCDARRWAYTPSWWSGMMQQRRHMGLCLVGDCQNVGDVEVRLRRLIGRLVQVQQPPCKSWPDRPVFRLLIPAPVKYLLRRWPMFWAQDCDIQTGDDPAKWRAPGKVRRVWLHSHAFHGHATWELMPGADLGDLSDEKSLAAVEALRKRAAACNAITDLPSYADARSSDPATDDYFERHVCEHDGEQEGEGGGAVESAA